MFGFFNRTFYSLGGQYSGWAWIRKGLGLQRREKIENLRKIWHANNLSELPQHIHIQDVGSKSRRNVIDVSFSRTGRKTRLGFYDIAREEILNAAPRSALVEDLQLFLLYIQDNPPPIDKASLRLRVNHHGQRGIWIDASNINIRSLLNEKKWLLNIREDAHVEMGQKRKYITQEHGDLRLDKPVIRPWFVTHLEKRGKDVPLWNVVGGFTQPSIKANRLLVHRVLNIARTSGGSRWLEFGAGSGNFTLPFASQFEKISATETFPPAREGLNKSIRQLRLSSKAEVLNINLLHSTEASRKLMDTHDALLVDPPRSGLHHTLNTLAESQSPPSIILYVSCFAEALTKDASVLSSLGYKIEHIEGIDQFPNTPHCQWMALFQKK